jgi:predicted Zn finger-like uncharacterized protein
MRIQCPSCAAVYDVPDTLLPTSRVVRCAACAHDWTAVPAAPPAPEPEAPAAAEPEPLPEPAAPEPAPPSDPAVEDVPTPAAMDRLAASYPPKSPPRRPPNLLTAAWAASLVLIASLATLGVTGRETVMRAWPPSTRLYHALGVAHPVAPEGAAAKHED